MYRMGAADCRAGTDAGSSVAGLAVGQHTDDRPWLMPGLITKYGPSVGRATGFFLTWFVYIIGSIACLYYGCRGLI